MNVYRQVIKKPIPVQFTKLENTPQSIIEVYRFVHGDDSVKLNCTMANDYWDNYSDVISKQGYLPFSTLESGEGTQNANIGDYILKGIEGECWPVKPDIFERTYNVIG